MGKIVKPLESKSKARQTGNNSARTIGWALPGIEPKSKPQQKTTNKVHLLNQICNLI